jgi:DNA-binding MarR family transcriptional regulator
MWETLENLEFFQMVNEIFDHRHFGAQETYIKLLKGEGNGKSLKEIAESRGLSTRTIKKHLDTAVERGVAIRGKNGSITLKQMTMDLLCALIPEHRRKIHGWEW